jgi:hypothetical protein
MKIRNPKPEIRLTALARQCAESANSSSPRKNQGCAAVPISDFGFRISTFFRPSAFGFRVSTAFFFLAIPALLAAAETNSPPDAVSSSLRPPRGEILPTFWEQYGAWVILLAVFLVAAIAVIVWLATRPKPVAPVPWAVQARRQLEPFRSQPENGIVLSRISQILRHHLASGFGLPSGETTTSEFCRSLASSDQIGLELSRGIGDFLKDCDLRKFAPGPPPIAPCDAIARSLRIIEQAEKRLADLQRAAAASAADSGSSRPSNAGPQPGLASGA